MIVPEWVVHKLEFTQLRESENYAGLMKLINQVGDPLPPIPTPISLTLLSGT